MRNLTGWAKGKEDERLHNIELKSCLEKTIDFIRQHYNSRAKIRLICAKQWQVCIKKTMLEQILCNCLLNALQAQANKIMISVQEKENSIQILIVDNGKGFSETELAFPFVPFRSRKKEGLGLGLTLCQRLIHSMRGEIYLKNRPAGKGAMVILELPINHGVGGKQ